MESEKTLGQALPTTEKDTLGLTSGENTHKAIQDNNGSKLEPEGGLVATLTMRTAARHKDTELWQENMGDGE